MGVVELKEVSKIYMLGNTEVRALRGVSFSIEKGAFVTIAGPSGSGKSTILNMIGLIDEPTKGVVSIDGMQAKDLTDNEITDLRLLKIGFIFQSFNLIPVLNVFENIEFPLLIKKSMNKSERRNLVMHFVKEADLEGRIKNKPGELSGGQRQRVAIARALVTHPVIILADEPTANLDTETGERIISLMKEINKNENTTFIFSTHDEMIMKHARRIIHIRDGNITADDSKKE